MDSTVTSDATVLDFSRSRTIALVPFLFGVTARSELPGTVLVRLLGDLEVSASAARAVIHRLRQSGNLVGERHGRAVSYRLGGPMGAGFRRLSADDLSAAPEGWAGAFDALLYQIPERHRGFRDSLRHAAVQRGYGILQQGVLIAPSDRWASLADLVADPPTGAHLYHATLRLDTAEAARAASVAWQLPILNDRYREHERVLRAALDPDAPAASGPAALRRYNDLVNPPLRDILRSPRLPAELRPAQWSLPSLQAALDAVGAFHYPAVRAYLDTVLAPVL